MKGLKVYGWDAQRRCGQTREIVAATSKSEAARLAGFRRPSMMWNLTETGNAVEIAVATRYPSRGCVCWKPLDDYDPLSWKRDALRGDGGPTA